MANQTLGITITSNVSGALPGISNTTSSLNSLGTAATNATTQVNRLAPAFQQNRRELQSFVIGARAGQLSYVGVGGAATQAGRAMQASVRPAVNAGAAITNLGRVASDAPFGFIAIQNNLDPLIGSFQSLVTQTGSVGGAFKALGAALAGPAGIALAFSVVSAGATTLIQKYGSLGNAFAVLNPFIDRSTRLQTELDIASQKAGAEALKESSRIELLYRATQDLNVPLDERKKIVDNLISQYPQTFKGLSQEAFLAGQAADAYERLKTQLLATAVVKAGDKVIEGRAAKLFELRQELSQTEKSLEKLIDQQEEARNAGKTGFFDINGVDTYNSAIRNFTAIAANQRKEVADIEADIRQIQDEQLKVVEEYGAVAAGIAETADKREKKEKTVKTDLDKQLEVIKSLRENINALNVQFTLGGETLQDLTDNKVGAFKNALVELSRVGAGPGTDVFDSIRQELQQLQNTNRVPVTLTIPVQIEPIQAAKNDAAIQAIADGFDDNFSRAVAKSKLAETLEKQTEEGLAGIGAGIGRAIAGGGIGAVVDSFVDGLASLGEALGKQLIAQGVAIEAFKASLESLQGFGAIAAGVALIAASAAFRGLAKGGISSFATGGGVFGPQLALVGDNPGREEYIIPSEVLDKMDGGTGQLMTRLTVNEFLIWLDRGRRNQ